jgi:hypothetical protein
MIITTNHMRVHCSRILAALLLTTAMIGTSPHTVCAQTDSSAVGVLKAQAVAVAPLVKSSIGHQFLDAVPHLMRVTTPRVVWIQKDPRKYLSNTDYNLLPDSAKTTFTKNELDESFYYNTRYGTPLAFVRPLDLLGQAGLKSLSGAHIVDFGFGSIGQLRLMASLGADVTGIEVDKLLPIVYGDNSDVGPMPNIDPTSSRTGSIKTLYGSFPSDTSLANKVSPGLDAFISKNTLKRGYIHPEREVDPRMLVHLGVDDTTFVRTVYNLLKPGGYFMIYNLHPKLSSPDEKFIPWSDGRCPFDRALLEKIGFKILAYDMDDTEFARTMGNAFGWAKDMSYDKDLFGMYTLMQK